MNCKYSTATNHSRRGRRDFFSWLLADRVANGPRLTRPALSLHWSRTSLTGPRILLRAASPVRTRALVCRASPAASSKLYASCMYSSSSSASSPARGISDPMPCQDGLGWPLCGNCPFALYRVEGTNTRCIWAGVGTRYNAVLALFVPIPATGSPERRQGGQAMGPAAPT